MSRRRLLLLFLAGVMVYFGIAFTNRAMDNYQVRKRAEALRQEVAALEEENRELRESLDYYASDTFVEKEAREKLNMVRPGEHPLVIINAPTPAAETASPSAQASAAEQQPNFNWQRWWQLFTRER